MPGRKSGPPTLGICDDRGVNSSVAPTSIAPPAANYSHAVVSVGAQRLLHTSGVVPIAPDGSVPPGLPEQAEVVWANIQAILREADMQVDDVVSITTYVVQGEELAPVMAARDRVMAGHRPASTLVVVPSLARSEWRVEIAVVAAR
jgi:enamine deaminase RidA (YjgF/YER057c/UK114 family)